MESWSLVHSFLWYKFALQLHHEEKSDDSPETPPVRTIELEDTSILEEASED